MNKKITTGDEFWEQTNECLKILASEEERNIYKAVDIIYNMRLFYCQGLEERRSTDHMHLVLLHLDRLIETEYARQRIRKYGISE